LQIKVKDSELLPVVFPPRESGLKEEAQRREAKRRKQDKFQEEVKFWKIQDEWTQVKKGQMSSLASERKFWKVEEHWKLKDLWKKKEVFSKEGFEKDWKDRWAEKNEISAAANLIKNK